MKAIEAARAHFGQLQTRQIEVPEWAMEDGAPLIIYAPPLTLADKAKLAHIADEFGHVEMLAHVLVMKAQDAQGKPLFGLDDKHILMRYVDPNVLSRVAVAITRAATVAEQEKNS